MDWQAAAGVLADRLGFAWMPRQVERAMREGAGPLFVACSGGADSVFASLAVWAYLNRHDTNRQLVGLHFDHAMRGEVSVADAGFVEALFAGLGAPVRRGRAEWKVNPSSVSEDQARAARLRFFEAELARAGVVSGQIATGHQRDDIAESLLMRLSRGSGLQGLAAPRTVSRASERLTFLRPLLTLGREEIRGALRAAGVTWREDGSNDTDRYYRNRLRRDVIPGWEGAADRPLGPGVARSRSLLEEDWQALEAATDDAWLRAATGEGALDRRGVGGLPRAVLRRLLARLCGELASAAVVDRALDAWEAGEEFDFALGPGRRLIGDVERVVARPEAPAPKNDWGPVRLVEGCPLYLPDGAVVRLNRVAVEPAELERLRESRGNDAQQVLLVSRSEKQSEEVSVRRRRGGDAFVPHGKSSARKLNDLLIERKIERERRDRLPVFVDGSDKILWVPGIPPSADRLLTPGTRQALRLTYLREVSTFTRLPN